MSQIYELLANLLEYPDEFWGLKLDMCQHRIGRECLELARPFSEFYRNVEGRSVVEMQELYTSTFDLNPVCALEAGYHLFGEDYRRGQPARGRSALRAWTGQAVAGLSAGIAAPPCEARRGGA